jgi:hypothetical protein
MRRLEKIGFQEGVLARRQSGLPQPGEKKNGAPGEIRTPDLLLRSVIQELHNPVTALLFCDLAIRLFGEIPLVLRPSCSFVTYCSKTQWVMRKGTGGSTFLKFPHSYLFGLNHVTSEMSKRRTP